MSTSISSSISIHRMRNGQTVYLSLASDKALYQFAQSSGGSNYCSPDWTVAANQPTITPTITSLGAPVPAGASRWYYNGKLIWDSASSVSEPGWTLNSDFTVGGSATNYALTIKKNLALDSSGQPRVGADVFRFETVVTIDNVTQTVSKEITATMQKAGASGYFVALTAIITAAADTAMVGAYSTQLSENGATAIQLSPTVYDNSSGSVLAPGTYSIEWYAGTVATSNKISGAGVTENSSTHTLIVDRSGTSGYGINGAAVILCRALDGSGNEMDVDGITITDVSDPYIIVIEGTPEIPDTGATFTAHLLNQATGSYSNTAVNWEASLRNPDDWTLLDGFGAAADGYKKKTPASSPAASFDISVSPSEMSHGGVEFAAAELAVTATI